METLIPLPIILLINKLVELNREINGRWISYLYALILLLLKRRTNKNGRFQVHDVWNNDPRHAGFLPFKHEWDYELPAKDKSEDILIHGTNSSNQSLSISIKWRPNSVENLKMKVNASVKLRFDDNDGNYYTLDEESIVDFSQKEYKVCGLGFEILCPFRRNRIKFRGYLLKNDTELLFVQIRFLWLALSKVYDLKSDFDDYFMAKELTLSQQSEDPQFEDRFEQFGQIKGTFKVEKEPQKQIYLWGSKSKKYLPKVCANRTIVRICGYNKKGFGFHIGLVSHKSQFSYRYGFLFAKSGRFHNLQQISVSKADFQSLSTMNGSTVKFSAKFGDKQFNFEIEPQKSLAHKLLLNGHEGMCFILQENDSDFEKCSLHNNQSNLIASSSLVLSLAEESAKSVELSGGKGSSLSQLMHLSDKLSKELSKDCSFNVPNGIVVTTNAYKALLRETDLEPEMVALEKSAFSRSKHNLKDKCDSLVNFISKHKLPQSIRTEIEQKLKQTFISYEHKLFAVRSSAAGEDSEEMSAAGQMTTFLGVKGLEDICDSVMKCWSSQFSFVAVQYKRSYGQLINSPMAVVIQEMVDCDSAGVIFTCDPTNGDERLITITANYGLGESVVSASADPDTISVSVNIKSNSLLKPRSVNKIESKQIGSKKTTIKLADNGGVIEQQITDNDNCCISDNDILRLADIAVKIHSYYGNTRDIEWGLKDGKLFMLQSRPVTNLDNSFTEYEIMHEMDSPHNSEFEIYSRAHWGENFPGSSSWMVYGWTFANRSSFFRMGIQQGKVTEEDYNPFVPGMGICYNQLMFNLTSGGFDVFTGYPESKMAKQMVLAFFGHHIDDADVLEVFKEKAQNTRKPTLLSKLKMFIGMIYILLFGPRNLMKTKTEYIHNRKYDLVRELRPLSTSKQIFDYLINVGSREEAAFKNHGPISFGSSMKNMFLRSALESAKPNNPFLESDFNLLISSCNEVVSAEVPNTLREIAKSIVDKEGFKQLSDEEALQSLKNGTDEASQKFHQFLLKHGHRGYREIDPLHLPWADNPMPCVKTIKTMLFGGESALEPKKFKSIDEVVNEVKTPLSFFKRLLIRKFLLPWSRDGVGYREHSKYFMIWMNNKFRQAIWYLAQKMADEGIIPETDLLFYMTADEIERLCNGERDALILSKARLRKRTLPKMNKYKFEEIIKGPEMKPRNLDEDIPKMNGHVNGSVRMSGTPVSNGRIKARVCVAEDITDADNIQPGDILITYSTDIGWSPYFPIISGIVTEIGGTISHGAVIAREYGIPCLIAVDGACRAFTTGDICILDTETAQIVKVES